MFTEDVKLGVMPLRFQSSDGAEYKVAILGDDDAQKKTKALLKSLSPHDHYGTDELFSDAIEEVIQQLTWHGQAVFEISQDTDDESICFLHNFTPQRLFRAFGYFVQIIPKGDREFWEKTITILPKSDIWAVSMPDLLGGYKGYRAILRGLKKYPHLGPDFFRRDIEKSKRLPSFDLQRYVREADIFYSQITRKWGWNRRDFSQENWTEFMLFYRILTFRWAQAVLREHVIAEFNALLVRLGVKAEVRVSGLPSPADILEIRGKMSTSDISFLEASQATEL